MARVQIPPVQKVDGGFINGARITGVVEDETGDPATGYTTPTGDTEVSYPLISGTEGEFDAYFKPGIYIVTFDVRDDAVDNPWRWDAASGTFDAYSGDLIKFANNVSMGRNPDADRYPSDPSKWSAITFYMVTDREGGDRLHVRTINVASLDKPEIVYRTFGPQNTAPFGPNQDGTDLEGVQAGGGLGRVTFQGRPAGTDNYGPHSTRINARSSEQVRADSLSTTLAVEATLPTAKTLTVNGNVGAITAADGSVQSWRPTGTARIGTSRTRFAAWKYDSGSNTTKLFGCSGGGVAQALLVTSFADADANVRFRSRLVGTAGNAITVRYVDPATTNASLSIGVVGTAITVNLATDSTGAITTTGNDVVNAIRDDQDATDLVEMSRKNVGNGTSVVEAMAVTNLAGGANTTTYSVGQTVRMVVNKSGGSFDVNTSTLGYDELATRQRFHSDGTVSTGEGNHENPPKMFSWLGGSARFSALSTPVPTAEVIGTTGTASVTYKVVAVNAYGETSLAGSVTVANAPNTLDTSNYIKLTWPPIKGALAYNIARTASTGSPATTGLIIHQQPAIALGANPVAADYGRPLAAVDEVQTVQLNDADAGTFTLIFDGQETIDLAPFDDGPTIKAALEDLSTIGAGDLTVEEIGETAWRITFGGSLAGTNVSVLTVGDNSLINEDDEFGDPEDEVDVPSISIRTRVVGGPVTWTEPTRNTTGDLTSDGMLRSEQGIELTEQSADPPAPDSTHTRLYVKSDGLYTRDSSVTEGPYATEAYADLLAQGVKWKESCRVATTANITLQNQQTIDGVAVVANDRVLVKDQTTASQNGIYICKAGTSWTRATDADTATELESATVAVASGTANANTTWRQTATSITLGTTAIAWTELAGITTAGAGLTRSGNTVDVGAGSGITVNADDVAISATVAGAGLTHTTGVLAVGAGTGISVAADSVSADPSGFNLAGTHAARPAAATAGRTYFETDTHVLYRDTGSTWMAISPGFVAKATTETVNNSNTLQDDDELFWPVENGERWFFDLVLKLNGPSTTPDYKFGWTVPGAMRWTILGSYADFAPGSGQAAPVGSTPGVGLTEASTISIGGLSGRHQVRMTGTVTATSSANVVFRWAQDVATVANSQVESNSMMNIRRLD